MSQRVMRRCVELQCAQVVWRAVHILCVGGLVARGDARGGSLEVGDEGEGVGRGGKRER